jgi:hypothetical protein
MSSVTKDPGVSSILLFSGSGINFPRPLYIETTETNITVSKRTETIRTFLKNTYQNLAEQKKFLLKDDKDKKKQNTL